MHALSHTHTLWQPYVSTLSFLRSNGFETKRHSTKLNKLEQTTTNANTMSRQQQSLPSSFKMVDVLTAAKLIMAWETMIRKAPARHNLTYDASEILRFFDQPVVQRELLPTATVSRVKATAKALNKELRRFNIKLHT